VEAKSKKQNNAAEQSVGRAAAALPSDKNAAS